METFLFRAVKVKTDSEPEWKSDIDFPLFECKVHADEIGQAIEMGQIKFCSKYPSENLDNFLSEASMS